MSTKPVILLGMLILLQVPAAATEYYVDIQNGSNQTGDGSMGNPWRNITYALAQISGTGHTIHVAPGVYDKSQDVGGLSESFPIQMETGVSIVGDQGAAVTVLDALNQSPRTRVIQAVSIAAGTVLQGLTIKNGQASDSGGGIYMSSSSMTVQDCIVESNAVSTTGYAYGSGIYISGGVPVIDGCIIRNNTTSSTGSSYSSYGGGVYVSGSAPTITDNMIIGNLTSQSLNPAYGGGLYISSCASGSLARNTIKNNSVSTTGSYSTVGGGLYMTISSVSILQNTIESNTLVGAVGYLTGGGLYLSSSSPSITRNRILSNQQHGLYISGGSPVIKNNVVARNGNTGVTLSSSTSSIINNSFVNNTGHGLYCSSSGTSTARNNAACGNSGYGIYEASIGSDFIADFNLFYNNTSGLCFDEGTSSITTLAQLNITPGYTNNIEGNPLFLNEAGDDYRLTSASAAKDAGSATSAPTDDLDGEPRPNGAGYDIGADEYYPPHAADTNANYVIENFEMLRWVDDWANSLITQGQLDDLKAIWSCLNGYKSDGVGGFTCR